MVCQKERNTDPILEAGKHVVSNPQTNQGTRADAVRHTKPWWATGINAASDDERGGGGGEWKEDGGTACLGSRTVAVGGGEVERGVPKGRKEGEVCDGWTWEWRQRKRPTQIADRGPQTANQTRPGAIKNNKHNKTSDASALTATVMTTAWAAAGEQEDGGQVAVASKQASVPSLAAEACPVGRDARKSANASPAKRQSPPHHRHFNGRGARKGGWIPLTLARGGA